MEALRDKERQLPTTTPANPTVFYQIYPRSFQDSNGDGIGDLPGITSRLDYLSWLGVEGIWLNPLTPSPNADWGYDVTAYCEVDPDFGTLEDAETLVRQAHERGIRVLFDLVPNHTSDLHPWFVDARSSRSSRHRDWYIWADPAPGGGPPNNWPAKIGGGSAWELDPQTGQYYLHSFLKQQPDLNWWNEEVRTEFDRILRFWFDLGVDGFRIDVVPALIKDRDLQSNPPSQPGDDPWATRYGQREVFSLDRPEVHEILRRWRAVAGEYDPPRLLMGETTLMDLSRVAQYLGDRDELTHAFNFPFILAPFDADRLADIVRASLRAFPGWSQLTWLGSNHDAGRFPTRWCEDDPRKTAAALMMLLALPGTAILYYGDEIGMGDAVIPPDRQRDPAALTGGPQAGRDRCRTPMQWSRGPGAGFTDSPEPWLPVGDTGPPPVSGIERGRPPALSRTVEDQLPAGGSLLRLTRDVIDLRKRTGDLRDGGYREVMVRDGLWCWRRGDSVLVCLNLSSSTATVPLQSGRILISTRPARDDEHVRSALPLEPWEGVLVEVGEELSPTS